MPITMVRRPQAVRRLHPAVRKEIKATYDALGQAGTGVLREEVASWSNPPDFTYKVKISKKKWQLTITYNSKSKAGKIYDWVSLGTGERGDDPAGKAYDITPKRSPVLIFPLPMVTKTMAVSGAIAPSAKAPPGIVFAGMVKAPGIYPRHLGENLYTHLKSHKSGSFRNVTEAAIKRAFRRLGIYVG